MKRFVYPVNLFLILLLLGASCRNTPETDMNKLIADGNWLQVELVLGQKIAKSRNDSVANKNYIVQLEKLSRMRKEFPLTLRFSARRT